MHKDIEDAVLKVYRKVSPSYREIDDKEGFEKYLQQRQNILNELCLPAQLFKHKKVLDIGGGTGESSLFYALCGADVAIIEPNEISCDRAKRLFERLHKDVNIINKSFFEIDCSLLENYEIVVCEGVLHHTYAPMKGLEQIISNIKKGTIVMVALAEYYGWFKRYLQRKLIRKISKSEDDIVNNAKKYFNEHIERAIKYGFRSERSVIYDTFVNPQIETTKLKAICETFHTNNILHYSSYPTLNCFYLTTPWSQKHENKFNYSYYKGYYNLLEKIWMTSGEDILKKDMEEFNVYSIAERIEAEAERLLQLEKKIENMDFEEEDLQIIQKGYMGIGINYFVGIKQ